jgi:hypothetical protein
MSSQSLIFRCYDWKCLYFSQLFSTSILNTYTHQSAIMASQANEGTSGSKDAKQKTHSTIPNKEIFLKVLQQGW